MKKLMLFAALLLLGTSASFAQDDAAKMAKKDAKQMKKDARHMKHEAGKMDDPAAKKEAKMEKRLL